MGQRIGGLICINHFKDEDLIKSKSNETVQLAVGAIPFIDSIETEEMSEQFETENKNRECCSRHNEPPTHDMIVSEQQQCEQCSDCSMKDLLIKEYETKIERMEKQLSELNTIKKSLSYFKAAKSKLNEELLKLKRENSINLELIKELEVS